MNRRIAVIGHGYVGNALCRFFAEHYRVDVYDSNQSCRDWEAVQDAECALICVPTPSLPNGRCDISLVEESMAMCRASLYIIKSTIEPGTTDRLAQRSRKPVVFSPEYCGESSYWSPYAWDRDIKAMPYYIFGGRPEYTKRAVELYLPVAGPTKRYIQTTSLAAEMAKYMENSFYATKVTFCYEMERMCAAAGVDYNVVRELWLQDPRINPMHTAVFPENKEPFSGKCLPKDTQALVAWALEVLEYQPELLQEVLRSNARIGRERHPTGVARPLQ